MSQSKPTKLGLLVLGLASFGITGGIQSPVLGHGLSNRDHQAIFGADQNSHVSGLPVHGPSHGSVLDPAQRQNLWRDQHPNTSQAEVAQWETRRKQYQNRVAKQTPEEKAARQAKREAWLKDWQTATPEQKAARQSKMKAWHQNQKNQTPEQRAQRQVKRQAWVKEWNALTPEEKAHRKSLIDQKAKDGHLRKDQTPATHNH